MPLSSVRLPDTPVSILHLEDDAFDAELVEEFARRSPLTLRFQRVWTREAFAEALRERRHELILADHQLPAFNGEEALGLVREMAPGTPFIFVSGTLGEDVAVEALKNGATDYVTKQRLDRLPRAIERALREAAVRMDRERTEAALRNSEYRLNLALIAGNLGSWELDVPSNRLTLSATGLSHFGWDADRMPTLDDLIARIHPDDRARRAQAARTAFATLGDYQVEYRVLPPAGGERWIEVRGRVISDVDGQPAMMVGVTVDTTEQRRSEQALAALNAELASRVADAVSEREEALAKLHEAQKLETIGQLTGGVAHDFNNLLTPVMGVLDLLQRRYGDSDERIGRMISGALQSAERAKTLVQRLLGFARRQELVTTAVDMGGLVDGMRELIARSLGPSIEMAIEIEPDLPAARADPNQVELALLNLCVNARDAMPEGGRLDIAVGHRVGSPRNSATGNYVVLSVSDSGCGMDEETLARAVDPFFTTKELGKGTGLGLSMIDGLAAQLGGAFLLMSEVGKGTRAELWLPVSTQVAVPAPERIAARECTSRSLDILLVDDEDLVRHGTAEILRDLGHRVTEASGGAQALDHVAGGRRFDLMLSDYMMPRMDGAELVRRMREHDPALPVLLLTGYTGMVDADDVPRLAKPFRRDDLAASISRLIDGEGALARADSREPGPEFA